MKKLLFAFILLLIAGIGLFWYFRNAGPVAAPGEMVIQGTSEKVAVQDVYQAPATDGEKKPVIFNEEKDVLLSDTTEHQMIYFAQDQAFIIVITDTDIQKAREISEQTFLERLKIDKETACKLRVSVGVPFSVNEEASGLDYGLSFCPNGKPFPSQ